MNLTYHACRIHQGEYFPGREHDIPVRDKGKIRLRRRFLGYHPIDISMPACPATEEHLLLKSFLRHGAGCGVF